jgi:2-oxoglutarate dehydrogenase E2 component (dihydrolipoamide succinyltransferase)
MPQLGETVTEGTVTRWMKAVGDTVARDEPLFEVSTDKVDSEVPSPAEGVLTEILVPEGETVEVGARLAVIGDGSASGGDAEAPAAESQPTESPAAESPSMEAQVPAAEPAPAAAPPAPQPQVAQAAAPASGAEIARETSDRQAPPSAPAAGTDGAIDQPEGADQQVLSPMVRRLLADNGISASEVAGTGIGGRVTREDVLKVVDARHAGAPAATPAVRPSAQTSAPPAPVAAPDRPPATPSAPALARRGGEQVIPFSNMRRRTAEHMVRSKATSPHAFIAYEVDFENVERVRRAWGTRFKEEEGFSLTYLPFVARSTIEALRDFPRLNASVGDDALIVHAEVNLGIAVDLSHEGLIVPVIHQAEDFTLRGIARRVRDLADRARSRKLNADDIAGGTFSITNDGPFGTFFTVPIINQPQVGILATDGIARRPVVVTQPDGSESIAIHSTGMIGMSWDHRAVDGAYVSSFLARVAELLAGRDWDSEL